MDIRSILDAVKEKALLVYGKAIETYKHKCYPWLRRFYRRYIRRYWRLIALVAAVVLVLLIVLISCTSKDKTKPQKEESAVTVTEESSSLINLENREDSALVKLEQKKGIPEKEPVQEAENDDALTAEIKPGKIYYFNKPKDGNPPLITGLSINGFAAGQYVEDGGTINGRPFSTDNIRSIFEMNEYVDMIIENSIPDEEMFTIHVMPSVQDTNYYLKNKSADYESIGVLDGYKSDYGDWHTAQFFIDPEYENKPGYYDLVFVYKTDPVAMVRIKMVQEGALSKLSDEEIQKKMDEDR